MPLFVDISKKIDRFTLKVCFHFENEILALLGASGSGKSMTLKCIAGIETPDKGRIILNGRTLFDSETHINLPPQKRRVGYLFQQYALFPNMTVAENIKAGVRSRSAVEKAALTAEKIRNFKLEGLENKKPCQLSGGQQQRVALTRILINAPELLLLDEPFSALDSYLKWQLELALSDIIAQFSGDIIYVSHNRNEVYRLCDSVCVLNDGRSDPKVSIDALFSQPISVGAAMISGCKNISPLNKKDAYTAFCPEWGVHLKTGQMIADDAGFVGIRAHHLTFEPNENMILCTVDRVIDNVFSVVVMLKTAGGGALRMEFSKEKWPTITDGQIVSVYVAPKDVIVLKKSEAQ